MNELLVLALPMIVGAAVATGITSLAMWFIQSAFWAKLRGKNSASTPVEVIADQLIESRPLPMGRTDFMEWRNRIIAGACIPCVAGEDANLFIEGQTYALANMILHLGPTESHKPDAFFIHSLRKVCCNQVAHTIFKEIKESSDARHAAAKTAKLEVVNQN